MSKLHRKIMVLDDDPLLVELYSTAFRIYGYEVETSFEGAEGLKKLHEMKVKPNIILSDIIMPKMHGIEFLKKIKEDPELKDIPLVFLTNLGDMSDIQKGLELGALSYIVKSKFTPKQIFNTLKDLMDTAEEHKAPDTTQPFLNQQTTNS